MNPAGRRAWLRDVASEPDADDLKLVVVERRRQMMTAAIAGWVRDPDRRMLLGWIFMEDGLFQLSSKLLSAGQVRAMYKWVDPRYDLTGHVYLVSREFMDEIKPMLDVVYQAYRDRRSGT